MAAPLRLFDCFRGWSKARKYVLPDLGRLPVVLWCHLTDQEPEC